MTLTNVITFPLLIAAYLGARNAPMIEDLVFLGPLYKINGRGPNSDFGSPTNPLTVLYSLAVSCSLRTILVMMNSTLPCPGGMFTPQLIMGGTFGRFVGECLALIFPNGIAGRKIVPAAYALIAMGCFSASATHAFSPTFILLEAMGRSFHLPTLIAALIGISISKSLGPNNHDVIIKARNWIALLELKSEDESIKINEFSKEISGFLAQSTTKEEIEQALEKSDLKLIPIVKDLSSMLYLGVMDRKRLIEMMDEEEDPIFIDPITYMHVFSEETPAQNVHTTFSILQLDLAFILGKRQSLIGSINKNQVKKLEERFSIPFWKKIFSKTK